MFVFPHADINAVEIGQRLNSGCIKKGQNQDGSQIIFKVNHTKKNETKFTNLMFKVLLAFVKLAESILSLCLRMQKIE